MKILQTFALSLLLVAPLAQTTAFADNFAERITARERQIFEEERRAEVRRQAAERERLRAARPEMISEIRASMADSVAFALNEANQVLRLELRSAGIPESRRRRYSREPWQLNCTSESSDCTGPQIGCAPGSFLSLTSQVKIQRTQTEIIAARTARVAHDHNDAAAFRLALEIIRHEIPNRQFTACVTRFPAHQPYEICHSVSFSEVYSANARNTVAPLVTAAQVLEHGEVNGL